MPPPGDRHDHRPGPQPPDIIALVNGDIDAAVRDAADHTSSPYVAAGRLEHNLAPLRERLTLLAHRRPELLDTLAAHFGVAGTDVDLITVVELRAHGLLERTHEAPAATAEPTVPDTTTDARRLRHSTDQHRSPPGRPQPPTARPR